MSASGSGGAVRFLRAGASRVTATTPLLRGVGRPSVVPRRSPGPGSERYQIIRSFFTKQAQLPSRPPSHLREYILQELRFRRWNSSKPPSKVEDCPRCAQEGHTSSSSTTSSAGAGAGSGTSTPASPSKHHARPDVHAGPKRDHPQIYAPFIQRLISRHPTPLSTVHRPSKEELLNAASGWWERFRIRLKWFTIRGWRKFNMDDLSAFASWFVVGNTLWILIGTTTFVSAVFATLNSLSLQEYVARWISDYMTSETGVTVIFESAIVPKWGANTITFRNVYISRRPQNADAAIAPAVSPEGASANAAHSSSSSPQPSRTKAATGTPPSPIPFLSSSLTPHTYYAPPASETDNYTMFDINLDEVEVTLSFMRWLDGKGLIKDARIKGVRGVVDRRSVWWDATMSRKPEDWRHATRPGDFEFEAMSIEDALITVYQPGGQRPFNVSVFHAVIGPLRKRWLFYDVMSAEAITGQFDNCLFSLHMPQKLGKGTGKEEGLVKRMARFRIDGLPIEHAQYATGHVPPMSWITSGKLDAVLDIKFPFHPDDQVDFRAIMEEIGRNVGKIAGGDHPDSASVSPVSSVDPAVELEKERERRERAMNLREEEARQAGILESLQIHGADVARAMEAAAAVDAASSGLPTSTPGLNPGAARLARPPLRAPEEVREKQRKRDGFVEGYYSGLNGTEGMQAPGYTSAGSGGDVLHKMGDMACVGRNVTVDIDLRFRDLKAAVPLYTTDLSVANNALIRPIVAFINANRTLVPIHCTVQAGLKDFDGSWTFFETGLMSSISDQIYAALAHHVSSEAANKQRIRQVSIWGIQRGAEALLETLRNVVDPVHAQLVAPL